MKRPSAGLEEQNTEINMTPMIDCVFQLIIFFVVTMRYPQIERNMPAHLPKLAEGAAKTQETEKLVRYYIKLEYDQSKDPGVMSRVRAAIRDFKEAEVNARHAPTNTDREQYGMLAEQLLQAIPRPDLLAQGAPVRSFSALDGQLLLLTRTAKDSRIQIILDAARDVPFMFVTRVQDICSMRGFSEISYAAKKEE